MTLKSEYAHLLSADALDEIADIDRRIKRLRTRRNEILVPVVLEQKRVAQKRYYQKTKVSKKRKTADSGSESDD